MIIACATDEAYAEMAAVLLRSLAIKGEIGDARVYLIGDELSAQTVAALQSCAEGLDYRFIDLAAARRAIADLPISFYKTAIHIRLLLPSLLPEHGRLLYLDSDMLVNGSLRPLFDMPIEPFRLAAVEDCGGALVRAVANPRLGHRLSTPYFNSGMLLFDLDEWRREKIGETCIATIAERDDFWPDQDAINLVLEGRIKSLDPIWNFFSHDVLPREAFEPVRIVHFIPDKPLSPDCGHPLFDEYLAIRATTPWRDRPLTGSVRQRQIERIRQTALARVRRWKQQQR